jgi:hypothetical protein
MFSWLGNSGVAMTMEAAFSGDDIGKIGIPAASLRPGRLTPDERDVTNEHARHRRSRMPPDPIAQLGTACLLAPPWRLKHTGCEDTRHSDATPFNVHILSTT